MIYMLVDRQKIDHISMITPNVKKVFRGYYKLKYGGGEFNITSKDMNILLNKYDCAAQRVVLGLKLNEVYTILFNRMVIQGKLVGVVFYDPYDDMEVAVLKIIRAGDKVEKLPIMFEDRVEIKDNIIEIKA